MQSFLRKLMNPKFLFPFCLFILVFVWIGSYTIPRSIQGDGWIHALIIKEIAQTEKIVTHIPHTLVNSSGESRIYSPISYSELFHVVALPFYLLGDIQGLTFIPPFFCALTALFTYLLFRKINKFVALLAGVLVILINITRFAVVVPTMENVLLFAAIASIYFYYRFFQTQKFAHLITAALFIGLTAFLKQSGMILSFSIILHACLSAVISFFKHQKILSFKKCFVLILLTGLFSLGPLSEQIMRNGTIDFIPANTPHRFPFLTAKYLVDPQAMALVSQWLGPTYWPKQIFPDFLSDYAVLLLSQRKLLEPTGSVSLIFLVFLLFTGLVYLWKRHRFLFTLFVLILAIDLISTYITQTLISAYHVIGLGVLSFFVPFGIVFFQKQLKSTVFPRLHKYLAIVSTVLVATLLLYNNVRFFHLPSKKGFQKTDEKIAKDINSYKNIAQTISKEGISDQAIFLGYSTLFKLYVERDILWLNQMYDLHFPTIAKGTNEEEALHWLKQSAVEYIVIENNQIDQRGFSNYFPSSGLLTYIDRSQHFEKMYDDNNIRVWKIDYGNLN